MRPEIWLNAPDNETNAMPRTVIIYSFLGSNADRMANDNKHDNKIK
jgi:hypothetical protein